MWQFEPDESSETLSTPIISDNTAYVSSYSNSYGGVYAVDLYTGTEEWSFRTNNGAIIPTVNDNNVYLPTAQGDLYSLDKNTGEQGWETDITGPNDDDGNYSSIWGTCVVGGDAIYFASLGTLYSLSIDDGSVNWSFDAHNTITPVIGEGKVFTRVSEANSVDDVTNWIIAIDSATGTEQWRYQLEYGRPGSLAFDGRYVYFTNIVDFTSENKYVYALEPDDGSKVWEHQVDGNVFNTPAIDENNVYVSTQGATLYALSRNDGSEVWTRNISWTSGSPPTMSVAGNTGYICDEDQVIALDIESGENKWTYSDADRSLITVANTSIYLGGDKVRCLAPQLDPEISISRDNTNVGRDNISASATLSSPEGLIQSYNWNMSNSQRNQLDNKNISVEAVNNNNDTHINLVVHDIYGRSATTNRVVEYESKQTESSGYESKQTELSGHTSKQTGNYNDFSLFNRSIPAYLIGGGTIATAIYAWQRSKRTVNPTSSNSSTNTTTAEAESQQDSANEDTNVDIAYLQQTTEKIEDAAEAESDGDFERAIELYREAIGDIEEELPELEADLQNNFQAVLREAKVSLNTVSKLNNQRQSVIKTLQDAEQYFKQAIAQYAAGNQTVARIRFRQARDTFEDAQQAITESDTELFVQPIEVSFEEEATLQSMALEEFAALDNSTVETLAAVDVDSLVDLDADTDEMTPAVVSDLQQSDEINDEEAVLLTLLSWWYEADSREFESEEAISHRYEQADYGFKQNK